MNLKDRYERVSISALADAAGGYGCVSTDIRALTVGKTLFGQAVTVWVLPGDKSYYDSLRKVVKAGDVVVIAVGGEMNLAAICNGMVNELADHGICGLVVDGSVERNPGVEIPVFAKSVHPQMLGSDGCARVNEPVSLGGAVVCPGDYIVGNADGLIVIQRDQAEKVLTAAEALMAEEQKRIAGIS